MKHLALIAAACAGLILSGPAAALGRLADMQVIDRSTGATLQVYEHGGRRYVAGEPGHEYQISLTSREGGRLLAVGSVDGVNIVSGQTASTGQDGYVLAPWEQAAISGWRTSLNDIAAFYFTTVADSYATRTGRPDDLGVIGVALFREKVPCCFWFRRRDELSKRKAMDAEAGPEASPESGSGARAESDAYDAAKPVAPAMNQAGRVEKKDERLGTGYGRSEQSQVAYTDFERASPMPDEVVTVYYDSYQNLCKKGVIPSPRPQPHHPRAFPGGFVPAP